MSERAPIHVGFLTVMEEESGFVGGYLVTNNWGRPLEFRLSSAVQPNRVQTILYASSLQPYVCGELIGKTLVEKTGVQPELIVTDTEPAMELRRHLKTPVILLADGQPATQRPAVALPGEDAPSIQCHEQFPNDEAVVRERLASIEGLIDLSEPFVRIREAIGEARKMGVTKAA